MRTNEEWFASFEAMPEEVRKALWDEAKTASPTDGMQCVPQSWAVVVYETMLEKLEELRRHYQREI